MTAAVAVPRRPSVDVHGELSRRVTLEKVGAARRAPAATRERRLWRPGWASMVGASRPAGPPALRIVVVGGSGGRRAHCGEAGTTAMMAKAGG